MSFLGFGSGCGKSQARIDRLEQNHPLIKKAKRKQQIQETEEAIKLYYKALEEDSDLARAHLELAMIFDDERKQDYIRAIYHYQRYLEMRPESERREYVERSIQMSRISFAASLPNQPSEAIRIINARDEELRQARKQNEELARLLENKTEQAQRYLARLQQQERGQPPQPHEAGPEARQPVEPTRREPDNNQQQAQRRYTVVEGDTLSKIAKKVYGRSSRWRELYDANRSSMRHENDLRIGQVLIVP